MQEEIKQEKTKDEKMKPCPLLQTLQKEKIKKICQKLLLRFGI